MRNKLLRQGGIQKPLGLQSARATEFCRTFLTALQRLLKMTM